MMQAHISRKHPLGLKFTSNLYKNVNTEVLPSNNKTVVTISAIN
jgi:hypothetical protein